MKDVASEVKNVIAVEPQTATYNGTITGEILDKKGYESAIFNMVTGAVGAAVSAIQISWYIQHGESTLLTDAAYATGFGQTISAATSIAGRKVNSQLAVDLTALNRYIRVYATASLSWGGTGTTPTVPVTVIGTLGMARNKPPV
jgi:hypothetical protein